MIIRYIRHGIATGNERHRATGGLVDYELSENGIKELKRLVEKGIYPKDPGVLYSSQLRRTYETLGIIYPGYEINKTELLNERIFGEMELMGDEEEWAYKEKTKFNPWGCPFDYRVSPGAETLDEFVARVKRSFDTLVDECIEKKYDVVTIGGHGAFLKGLGFAYDIKGMFDPRKSLIKNGNVCVLEVKKVNGETVVSYVEAIGEGTPEEIFQVKEITAVYGKYNK